MITFNSLFKHVSELKDGQTIQFTIYDADDLRVELERLCNYEYHKSPQHPHFITEYTQKLERNGKSFGGGQRPFHFETFLEYMFTPLLIFKQEEVRVKIDGPSAIVSIQKRFIGCKHEELETLSVTSTDVAGGSIEYNAPTQFIVERCISCGQVKQSEIRYPKQKEL